MDPLLRNMIRQLNVALVNMKMYAPDHPTTAASFQRSYDALKNILEQKSEFALGVVDNTLIADESPVEESDSFIIKFIDELKVRNVEGLVFYTGISQDEFKIFLDCLSQEPERLIEEGGAQKFFESHGASHVLANEVKYGRIQDSLGEGGGLEEAVIAAFLMGKMPVFQADKKSFLSLLEEDPAKIGEVINGGFKKMKQEGGEGVDLSKAANRAVEQVGRFLEAHPEGLEKYPNIMAQIILSLDPEAQAGFCHFRATQEDYPQDRIDSLITEFKDEEVIRLVCNVYRGGLRTPQLLARVANRVLPNLERRQRIAPHLGQDLMKLGMRRETWEGLQDDILWESYTLDQKVDRLVSKTQLDKNDLERIRGLGPDLSKERKGGEIKKLLTTLLAVLQGDDPEIRANVAGYLPQFYRVVEDSGRFRGADLLFCQKLIARLKREPEETVRGQILRSLAMILEKEIRNDRFNTAARAILTLSNMGYVELLLKSLDSLVSQEVFDHLIAAVGGEDKARQNEALVLLKCFGKVVLEPILFFLEREETPNLRRRLMAVVRSMGPGVDKDIVKRLTDTRWYVVKNALYVLGEIGERTVSPDLLVSSIYHDDMRIRKEAIKTLGKMKSRGATKLLCELLEDKNEEIRLLVLKTLGEAGDRTAVPHILPFVEKKRLKGQKSDLIRQTAIEALGNIGDSQAIPPLLDLLRAKGFFRKEDEAIRRSVVEALGAMRDPELEGPLQSVIEKDADVAVREAARRALLNLGSAERKAAV